MTFANMNNLQAARVNLSAYMLSKAEQVARGVGFGYIDVANAPNDYTALMSTWNDCKRTKRPFPVWTGGSDQTIYTSCGANYAFRFWHDSIHALSGLEFTTADEIAIGTIQVKEVQKEFGPRSLESLLMYADTIAQSIYASNNGGEFPVDQFEFVTQFVSACIYRIANDSTFQESNNVSTAIAV